MQASTRNRTAQFDLWTQDIHTVNHPLPVVPELQTLEDLDSTTAVLRRLRGIDWSFTHEDTFYLGHDIHPYPAKFIPQIPSNLIVGLSRRGETVWDPFGGSGTAALEALLLGRKAISTDANPLATLIAAAKCTALSPEQRAELSSLNTRIHTLANAPDLSRILGSNWSKTGKAVPPIPSLEHWFSDTAVTELAYLKEEIAAIPDEACRTFALVAFSSIIVAVSFQDGETRYARKPRPTVGGYALRRFCRALEEALNKHEPLEVLLGYRRAVTATADIREIGNSCLIAPESVDLVVTSPPYANATDYHLYHRFRLFWLGFDPRQLARCEIGSHLRHQREHRGFELYAEEMSVALQQIHSCLRPGRYAALVLGDSIFEGKRVHAARAVSELATGLGFDVVGSIPRAVHATKRSFIPPARRTKSEEILLIRKSPRMLRLYFHPPAYRMWPFEKELRRRELAALLGIRLSSRKSDTIVSRLDCYRTDRAQRLTFTSRIETKSGVPSWRTWQSMLENGDSRTSRKDPKYLTHGIHPYKGKFYPQLAKSLLNLSNLELGGSVLDPFCGSGTVLLEAQLNGFSATGLDLNPMAALISRAKTGVAMESAVVLDRVMKDFYDRLRTDTSDEKDLNHFREEIREEITAWFPLPVARRLGWLLSMIHRVPNITASLVLQVLLSSTVRQVSQQAPEDLRIRRRKTLIRDAPVLELFRTRIEHFRTKLRHFGEQMSSSPVSFKPAVVMQGDSREWETFAQLPRAQFDCVLTSPPYATALPYIDTDRLSLLVLMGMDSSERARIEERLTGSREIRERERKDLEAMLDSDLAEKLGSKAAFETIEKIHSLNSHAEVGFRRRNMTALLIRYFSDMRVTFQNLARAIVPRGRLFFVIGDNRTVAGGREITIPSSRVLVEMGQAVGWTVRDVLPITVTREAPLHSRNSITENAVLHFEAPPTRR